MSLNVICKGEITAITFLLSTVESPQVILWKALCKGLQISWILIHPLHHNTNGKLWKSVCFSVISVACRTLTVQKTFLNCATSLTSIAMSLLCGFIPDETQCLPSSARAYPFAQEHTTAFCTLFLMLQNCSQSPLFILQYFGMTIKEIFEENL